MADCESLFSLEVVVESVENVVVSCHVPAIAFRLLDFPTLVIRSEEKERLNEKNNSTPMDPNAFCPIQSGKSCLFKMRKEVLCSRLESTPLYIMLLDISSNKTKLLASTTISLNNCLENVLQSIQRNGLDIPAVHGEQGTFELYNLMGTQVAIVKLCYRIFSLGGTINGHVKCTKSLTQLPKYKPAEDSRKKEPTSHSQRSPIEKDLVTQDLVDEKETDKFFSTLQLDVETQTDIYNQNPLIAMENCCKKDMHTKVGKESINITRPPPLYYNSKSMVVDLKTHSPKYGTRLLEKNIDKVNKRTPQETYRTVSVQTSEERMMKVLDSASTRPQLPHLPLINALLTELALAKQNLTTRAPQLQQCDVSSNDAQPAATQSKDKFPAMVLHPDRKLLPHKVKREIRPPHRKNIPKPKPMRTTSKGVLIHRNPVKFKKSSLKCGTTKTQKLREALNKKTVDSDDRSLCKIESKRPLVNNQDVDEKTKLIASEDKKTREFGCQIAISSYGNQVASQNEQETNPLRGTIEDNANRQDGQEIRDDGIRVTVCDNKELFNIVQIGTSNSKYNIGVADDLTQDDTNNLLDQTSPKYDEQLSASGDEELSSHSKVSSTSHTILQERSVKPTFSNFSPTRVKNTRYSNDEHSSGSAQGKSLSMDSALSAESGLVNKPIGNLSISPNSSSEHKYSDNFESLASEETESNETSDNIS